MHKCCCRPRTRLERHNPGDPIPERMVAPGATPSDESPPPPDRIWRQVNPVLTRMKDLAGGAWHKCRGWAASVRIAFAALVASCLTTAASFSTRADGEEQDTTSPSSDNLIDKEASHKLPMFLGVRSREMEHSPRQFSLALPN